MKKNISTIEVLEFQFRILKQELKNENTPFKNNKEYRRLQKAISRCKKKIPARETITPINVAEPSKLIEKKNIKNLALKKDTNKKNLQLIQKNSSPINVKELSKKIQTINLPVVGKTFTLAEKELLNHAKKSVVLNRAYDQKRSHPGLEILAIEKAVDQPPTVYDEQLLALWKLYPVVFSMFSNEGEEPKRLFVFGEDESKLRCLAKYNLFFPNGWPKIHESASIRLECELERVESELLFLKGLLKNNSGMKKNIPIAESIAHLTLKIGELKEDLVLNPVPTKPR